jgi:hypothetical protein
MHIRKAVLPLATAVVAAAAVAAFSTGSLQFPAAEPGALDMDPVGYHIADGAEVPGFDPADPDLARAAFEDWSRSSGGRLRFDETTSEDDAVIQLIWIPPGSGLYGEMRRVRVAGRLKVFVYVTPGVQGQGPSMTRLVEADPLIRDVIVYLTCLHELGHAVGLGHTAEYDDIMYSFGYGGDIENYFSRYRRRLESRDDIARVSGLSPNDRATLLGLYGDTPR